MRVLVCGGREFDDWELLSTTLSVILDKEPYHETQTIIEGGAKGADFLARVWAKYEGHEFNEYPAQWKEYGRRAGPIRNKQMLDEGKPDLVIAFPGGNGTADMVRQAREAGVEVRVIEDSSIQHRGKRAQT